MHAVGESGVSPVPAFLTKLWTLVKDPSTDEFIFWDATGKSFHVYDQGRFSKEVLPKYFKHSNIASFIRQLNMYGFRKVVGVESGGLKVEKDDMVFAHQYFQRENEGLLEHIKRKVPNMKADEMKVRPDDVQRVLNDVRTMKGKQDSVNSKLEAVKRENELLWLEIANLRQKHMKQQQIVNKLIQFLMSLVGNRGVDRKRKMPLMLNDASHIEVAKVPKFSHSRSIETAGKGYQVSSPEQTHTATIGDQVGTSTLSIHEVTDPIYEIAEGEIETAQATSDLVAAPDLDPPTHTVTPSIAPVETITEMMPPVTIVHPLNPEPASNVEEDEEDTHSQDILRELVEQNVPPMGAFNTGMVSEEPLLTLSTDVLPLDDASFGQINTMQPATVLCGTTVCSERAVGGSGAPRVTDAVLGAGAVVPTSTRQLSNPKVLNREISDHLDTMQGDLDSLKDLLSGGQYTFEPSTIMGMFELGGGMTSDQQPSTSSADFISGHEVVQYNPPDDILSLFDLGDLTSSTPLEEDDDDLNTPYVSMDIDGPRLLPVKPSAPISTEEVD